METDFAVTEAEPGDLERIARFLEANGVEAGEADWDALCSCVGSPVSAGQESKGRPFIVVDRGGAVRGYCLASHESTDVLNLPLLAIEPGPNGGDIYHTLEEHIRSVARERNCGRIRIGRLEPDHARQVAGQRKETGAIPIEIPPPH